MRRAFSILLIALVAIFAAPWAAARSASDRDVIVYLTRPVAVICSGVCPHFELAVRRDGVVVERFLGVTDEQTAEGTRRLRRFRVSRAEAAAFFADLAPLRPKEHRQFGQPCDAGADPREVQHGLSEYEIRWRGGGAPAYLEACARDAPVRRAVGRALSELRVRVWDGLRTPATVARRARACWTRAVEWYC